MACAGWVACSLAWRGLARCLAGVDWLTGVGWLTFVVVLAAGWQAHCVAGLLTGGRGVAGRLAWADWLGGWRELAGWLAGWRCGWLALGGWLCGVGCLAR